MNGAKRFVLPDDTLERVRAVYLGVTLAVAAPYALGLLLSGQPVTSQAVGLLTLAALMTYRMAAYRRGAFPVLGDPLEVAARSDAAHLRRSQRGGQHQESGQREAAATAGKRPGPKAHRVADQ